MKEPESSCPFIHTPRRRCNLLKNFFAQQQQQQLKRWTPFRASCSKIEGRHSNMPMMSKDVPTLIYCSVYVSSANTFFTFQVWPSMALTRHGWSIWNILWQTSWAILLGVGRACGWRFMTSVGERSTWRKGLSAASHNTWHSLRSSPMDISLVTSCVWSPRTMVIYSLHFY